MTSELLISTILISLALVFYSIGVWSERLAGRLKGWHLVFFWGGLAFDATGTGMMFEMAAAFRGYQKRTLDSFVGRQQLAAVFSQRES
jgi:uncharacterized repeat protein (TIGR03987 family)